MRQSTYQVYVTDVLQLIPQNKYPTDRYIELLRPQDKRTGDEIAADVISRLELNFGNE